MRITCLRKFCGFVVYKLVEFISVVSECPMAKGAFYVPSCSQLWCHLFISPLYLFVVLRNKHMWDLESIMPQKKARRKRFWSSVERKTLMSFWKIKLS